MLAVGFLEIEWVQSNKSVNVVCGVSFSESILKYLNEA